MRHMMDKTDKMNNLLNNVIPYFRCSDPEVVRVYYYLWALHLVYYTEGSSGLQTWAHTQSAVNNFLGLHRWVRGIKWTKHLQVRLHLPDLRWILDFSGTP